MRAVVLNEWLGCEHVLLYRMYHNSSISGYILGVPKTSTEG